MGFLPAGFAGSGHPSNIAMLTSTDRSRFCLGKLQIDLVGISHGRADAGDGPGGLWPTQNFGKIVSEVFRMLVANDPTSVHNPSVEQLHSEMEMKT